MKVPSSPEEWLTVAEKFESRWQFPNCVGAMDGKHIVMQPPGNSGSYYYNYKHTNSIILMAVAGPNYECLYYDIGTNGRVNEGGVWNKCGLAKALEEGKMNFPLPCCLPGGNEQVPYVLIGDDAFALKPYLMKLCPTKPCCRKACITTGTAEQDAYQKTCLEYWPIGGGLCVMSCFFTRMELKFLFQLHWSYITF